MPSLSYSCDSPFFAQRAGRSDQDLEKLGEFLRGLTKQMRQFCRDAKTLSKSAEALGVHMKTGLGSHSNASLSPVMNCFGDIFAEIASSQEILAESLDNSCVAPLERFANEEVASVHALQAQYLQQRESNENIISKYLQSDLSNFGRGSTQSHLDMRAHEVVQQTKRFESVRYDFVRKVNEMEARKSFEVAESCVAGILSLNTYYHTCMDRLQSSKNFIEELLTQQQRDRAAFEVSMRPLDRRKTDINAVLEAMVERVEMASVFLQTDLSAASSPSSGGIDTAVSSASVNGMVDHLTGGGHAGGPPAAEVASSYTLSRLGAFMGGFTSSSKGGSQAGRKPAADEVVGAAVTATALCEECEARMKALDHSELAPFFTTRPDEQPAGAVKQGYLWRRVARKVMDTWERQWFILDESKLYYISESDDSYRINVICELMLANIRELKAYEVPFCFEVSFANFKTTIVQAEGHREYATWIQALRAGIETSLVSGIQGSGPGGPSGNGVAHSADKHALSSGAVASRRALMRPVIDKVLANSPFCAECDRAGPEWVSLNIGCLVCIDCSGVHRSMGVHISKMRSLTLDDLEPAEYSMLLLLGNSVTNSVWEKELAARSATKPTERSIYSVRDVFIRAKYQYKCFVTNPPSCAFDPSDLELLPRPDSHELWDRDVATRALCRAVESNDMVEIIRAVAADADVSGGLNTTAADQLDEALVSPLVTAIRSDALEAAVFLIINGASITQEASLVDSATPLGLAEQMGLESTASADAMEIFEQGGARAICSYIQNKAEQAVRLGGGAGVLSPMVPHSGRGSKDSDAGGSSAKPAPIVHTRSGSLTTKAKQFMARAASPSVSAGQETPGSSSVGMLSGRYRGASDFGSLPMSPLPRSRSKSNGDAIMMNEGSPNGGTVLVGTSGDLPPVGKQKGLQKHNQDSHISPKKGSNPPGGSKISQKMRSAFISTDFLFPHGSFSSAGDKEAPIAATGEVSKEEVFHQPFINRHNNTHNKHNSKHHGHHIGDEDLTVCMPPSVAENGDL